MDDFGISISMASMNHNADSAAAIDSALEIARRRAQTLGRIRSALESGDNAAAVKLMRVYCGLDDVGGGWTYTAPYNFNSNDEAPFAPLIFDAAGNLYKYDRRGGHRVVAHTRWGLELHGALQLLLHRRERSFGRPDFRYGRQLLRHDCPRRPNRLRDSVRADACLSVCQL
jgi:hypothetical protein